MTLGIVDVLEDQEKRNLIHVGFILPDVRVDIDYEKTTDASYIIKQNIIGFRKEKLLQLAGFDPDQILEFKSGRRSSAKDYMYFTGVEEIKPAIDYKAGKAIYDPVLKEEDDNDYQSRIHEYRALGERVLMGKKRNPHSESYIAEQKSLKEIINYRQSQNK